MFAVIGEISAFCILNVKKRNNKKCKNTNKKKKQKQREIERDEGVEKSNLVKTVALYRIQVVAQQHTHRYLSLYLTDRLLSTLLYTASVRFRFFFSTLLVLIRDFLLCGFISFSSRSLASTRLLLKLQVEIIIEFFLLFVVFILPTSLLSAVVVVVVVIVGDCRAFKLKHTS